MPQLSFPSNAESAGRRWFHSVRTKLLVFSLALVIVPGAVFAVIAFSSAQRALENAAGIQLAQTAQEGADLLGAALERERDQVRSCASQDLMREIVIGDLDKRVSRFLASVREGSEAYVDILCAGRDGRVVAASTGSWLGRDVSGWRAFRMAKAGSEAVDGPRRIAHAARPVLEIAAPIRNPDPPGRQIGVALLLYDWDHSGALLGGIRDKLLKLGKDVGLLIVDREGRVIGAARGEKSGHSDSTAALATAIWKLPAGFTNGRWELGDSAGRTMSVQVGAAPVATLPLGWSVLAVEPTEQALAPVIRMRRRWVFVLSGVLLVGLAIAGLLANRMVSPLREVTEATKGFAAQAGGEFNPLAIRSRDEVGELAGAFNKMASELRSAQQELLSAAKFAFAGELAAGIAHEVRTPLTVMRSSAQMLLQSLPAEPAGNSELVQMLVEEVDRVERVVTGLVELAKPQNVQMEIVSLNDVLSRAVELIQAQAAERNVTVEEDFESGPVVARCDREQIYQVALNLLVNALQALPEGGRILVRTLPAEAGAVGFTVEDNGPGIPEDIRDHIFRPFVTGREGGTGLGLALVQRVVEFHRGAITVETGAGGTRFHVRLPAAEEAA